MNQENKFRGKFLDTGEWVYGGFLTEYKDSSGDVHETIIDECGCMYEIVPNTGGLSSGLKDKNRTEIYEGDILLSYGVKYEVVYTCDAFIFIGRPINNLGRTELLWNLVAGYEPCKIIGNIHDNPELLKTE